MAHRIYIYNIQEETGESYPHYLGEWNYVLPPLLIVLFGSNLRSNGAQLYADKAQGISNLRRFYDLLGDTYRLHYKKAFYEPVREMFQFLEDLPYDTFQIDGSDVFNMNDQRHAQQAKDWVIEIKSTCKLYERAMQSQNLASLQAIVSAHGYHSYLDILQTDWINYGLGYWNKNARLHGYADIFTENGLEGLRDAENKILAPAIYQKIFGFSDDIAIIKKDNKFGYITTKGEVVVPPMYETPADVFEIYTGEFENDIRAIKVAVALQNSKYGLLDVKENQILIPFEYDGLEWVSRDMFNATINGQYFLVNSQNYIVIKDASATAFEFEFPDLYFTSISDSSKRKYYTKRGNYLGEFLEASLEAMPNLYYFVKANKRQKNISILNPSGNLMESDVEQIITSSGYQSFAYRKNQQWFLYSTTEHRQLAQEITISKLYIDHFPNYFEDIYVLVSLEGTGLFDAKQDQWLIHPNSGYTKIEHLDQHILRVHLEQEMKFWNGVTNQLSEPYTYVSEPIDRDAQQLLLYHNNGLYVYDNTNEIKKVEPKELGLQYSKRYNLRGNDLKYFNKFYQDWKKTIGPEYYQYFDNQSLYEISTELLQQGKTTEAIDILKLGAERKHPEMMTELAIIYSNEEYQLHYDVKQANELYQKAAQLGEKNAWNNLGYQLQNGIGIEQNTEKAIQAYTKAGELENGLGWANLGDLYYFGELVPKNDELALTYYLKAQKNYVFNDHKIVDIYFNKNEYKKVLGYIKKDYDEEFSPIYYAIMYEEGYGGLKINIKKAISYYEKALTLNHYPYAVTQLLFHYRKDSDFHNEAKFIEWLSYAKNNDIEVDQELLGLPQEKKDTFLKKIFKKLK